MPACPQRPCPKAGSARLIQITAFHGTELVSGGNNLGRGVRLVARAARADFTIATLVSFLAGGRVLSCSSPVGGRGVRGAGPAHRQVAATLQDMKATQLWAHQAAQSPLLHNTIFAGAAPDSRSVDAWPTDGCALQ